MELGDEGKDDGSVNGWEYGGWEEGSTSCGGGLEEDA